jgi:hypothetical protein
MDWTVWLGIALVIAVIAALTGVKPRGSRPVARTQMMGVARVVLIVAAVIIAVIAFRS